MARKGRQLENRPTRDRDDREPIVTYSRLEADRLGSPYDFDEFEPAGPLYEAVEVPRVDRPPPRDAFVPEPELRAERAAIGPDPFEAEARPRRFGLLLVVGIGVIAIAAGVGVLLTSIGSSSRIETSARTPVPAAGTADTAGAAAAAAAGSSGIRQIPIGEGDITPVAGAVPADATTGAGEPAVAVDPPAPRPRPDRPPAATVSAQPEKPAVATAAAPAAKAAPADGDAAFISRIEKTLADIDAARAQPAPAAPATEAPTTVVAPAALPADPSPNAAATIGGENGPVMDGDGAAMDGDGTFDTAPTSTQAGTVTGPLPTPPGTIDAGALLGTNTPGAQPIPPRLIPPADIPNVPATGTAN